MVYKRRYKPKRKPKRRMRRKYPNYAPGPGQPFPNRYKANFRYVENVSLDPTAGSMAYNTWSANSLYDPNTTGAGHQPMGFDQIAPLYNRYIVTGCKLTATFESRSGSSNATAMCGITTHETSGFSGASSPVSLLIEQAKTNYTYLGVSNSGASVRTLTRRISMRKEFAVKDLFGNLEEYGALTSGSPTNGSFVTTWAVSPNGTDDPVAVNVLVKIEYTGYFFEPKLLGQS